MFPQQPPFIYRANLTADEDSPRKFYGYCVDLLETLAERLQFDYEMYEVKDSGEKTAAGSWSGIIGELVNGVIAMNHYQQ